MRRFSDPFRAFCIAALAVAFGFAGPMAAQASNGDSTHGAGAVAAIRSAETNLGLGAAVSAFWAGGTAVGAPGGEVRASRLGPGLDLGNLYTGMVYDVSGAGLGPAGGTRGLVNRVEVRLGSGFRETGRGMLGRAMLIPFVAGGYEGWSGGGTAFGDGGVYHAALAGGGIKVDLAVSSTLVVSATAEGLAVLGGRLTSDTRGVADSFGVSGEASVRLGADLRLSRNWQVFAGLGVRYRPQPDSAGGTFAGPMPVSTTELQSVIGLAYGFR